MRLSALAPFRNPIFEREFVALCRTRRWFILRTLLVAFLTIATWIVLASDIGKADRLDETGEALFFTGVFVQVGFVFFLGSGLCSDLIVTERRNETLDIVLTTPLSPRSIVLGKLLSRLCLIVVMVASSFPLISVALLYGGVSGRQVIGLFQITLGTILLTAGPAALVSVYARRLGTAAVLSQIIPVAWCLGSPFLLYLMTFDWDAAYELLSVTHPLIAVIELSEAMPFITGRTGIDFATWYLAFGASVTGLCTLVAILRLRRERTGDAVGIGRFRKKKEGHDDATAEEARPVRSRARRRLRLGRLRNPVLWKEINLINASTSRALFWTMAILLLGAEALFLLSVPPEVLLENSDGVHLVFASCCVFVLLLLTVVNAATAIVTERRQGTLELLHTTPITVKQIVEGKIAGVLRSVALLALVPLLHLFFAAIVTEFTLAQLFAFTLTFATLVLWFAVVGIRASIRAVVPGRAIVQALIRFALVMVGYPVLILIIAIFFHDDDSVARFLVFHPIGFVGFATALVKETRLQDTDWFFLLFLAFVFYAGTSVLFFRTALRSYRTKILGRPPRRRRGRRVQ